MKFHCKFRFTLAVSVVPWLIPVKGMQFRTPQFADIIFEFMVENGQVKGLKRRDPSGEFTYPRQ